MLVTGPLYAQITVGPNINISKKTGYQAEVSIAVNPTDPTKLFAFSNQGPFNDLFGAFSINSGATWTGRNMATGADNLVQAIGDPSCTFDSFGNLFVTYLDKAGNTVEVGQSADSGATFKTVASLAVAGRDQPTVVTGANSVWLTYRDGAKDIQARGVQVNAFVPVPAALGFSAAQMAPSSNPGNFGDIAISRTGKVVVTYQDQSTGEGLSTIRTNTDPDGLGVNPFNAAVIAAASTVGPFDAIPATPNRKTDAETGLAYDNRNGAGNLYMVYASEIPDESNDTDIFFRKSTNDGATWSLSTILNDNAGSSTTSQFFPKIAVDPVTGWIGAVWYDARNDATNNRKIELWGTASMDGGLSFLPNFKISAGQSDIASLAAGVPQLNELSDYIGLTFYGGIMYPAWGDNSNSTGDNPDLTANMDIYTAKVTLVPEPATLVLLATGGLALAMRRRRWKCHSGHNYTIN